MGLKLWTPAPLVLPTVSWVGLLSHLLSSFAEVLSSCVQLLLSTLSLCRHLQNSLSGCGGFVGSSDGDKSEHLKSEKHKQWEKANKSVRPLFSFLQVTPAQST